MNINEVGQHKQTKMSPRNFYDLAFRGKTEVIIREFYAHMGWRAAPSFEWKNLGREDDIYAMGVALRINNRYQINYMMISEDFDLWYFDPISPKEITTIEESDCLEDMMSELFRCLAEDKAKDVAASYFDMIDERGDFPSYPDEPKKKKQKVDNSSFLEKVLKT